MFGQGLFCLNSETMIDYDWNLANLILCITSITRAEFFLATFVGGHFFVEYQELTPLFFCNQVDVNILLVLSSFSYISYIKILDWRGVLT